MDNEVFSCIIDAVSDGKRLDVAVAECASVTRSRAGNLLESGMILVNGAVCLKPSLKVHTGDRLQVTIPKPVEVALVAQDIDLKILYQDSDLAVVYKPSGMVVHPAAGNPDGTLVNALMHHLDNLSGINGELRPGIVHRIDKDTSGLLLVAKNDAAHLSLSEQIRLHNAHRAYVAIAQGHMKENAGHISGPIGRHPTDRKKMAIVRDGREAETDWKVLQELNGASYIECVLTTGRTHQIRVHMASIGHPLLGDPLYGPKKMPYPVEGGQLLHAYRIGFVHPRTGEEMIFVAPPEERFLKWLEKLGGSYNTNMFERQ